MLPYPAFSGFDPAQLLVRHEVNSDNNNFGPAFGFAWSPGAGKTVWRGGYQISYDAFFTQMVFLGPATRTPNAISTNTPPKIQAADWPTGSSNCRHAQQLRV